MFKFICPTETYASICVTNNKSVPWNVQMKWGLVIFPFLDSSWWRHTRRHKTGSILVSLGDGLLPDGTKLSPDPELTNIDKYLYQAKYSSLYHASLINWHPGFIPGSTRRTTNDITHNVLARNVRGAPSHCCGFPIHCVLIYFAVTCFGDRTPRQWFQ